MWIRWIRLWNTDQCCGSGLDPDSMGSLDPDPDPGAKITYKNKKTIFNNIIFVFFGHQTLDPDPDSLEMLNPDQQY